MNYEKVTLPRIKNLNEFILKYIVQVTMNNFLFYFIRSNYINIVVKKIIQVIIFFDRT